MYTFAHNNCLCLICYTKFLICKFINKIGRGKERKRENVFSFGNAKKTKKSLEVIKKVVSLQRQKEMTLSNKVLIASLRKDDEWRISVGVQHVALSRLRPGFESRIRY